MDVWLNSRRAGQIRGRLDDLYILPSCTLGSGCGSARGSLVPRFQASWRGRSWLPCLMSSLPPLCHGETHLAAFTCSLLLGGPLRHRPVDHNACKKVQVSLA
ncbi:hypothetical protein COCNU_scaffold007000G000010 [Cocos nucifera]|nr:hypothetical protein [Cocos nucifera]